jgi:hypothetical protein
VSRERKIFKSLFIEFLVYRTCRADSLTRTEFLHPKMSLNERINLSDFSSEDGLLIELFIRKEKFFFRKTSSWFNTGKHRSKSEVYIQTKIHSSYFSISLSSTTGIHLCDTCTVSLCSQCRLTLFRSSDLLKESTPNRTGSSSHSIASSDSAFCDQRLLDLNDHQNNSPENLL